MIKLTGIGIFIFSISFLNIQAQDSLPVTMPAGKQYKANGWKTFWWGKHYRQEWVTPVAFPVLHLDTLEGGAVPLKAGGGHQSKSLRILTNKGHEYVLRTMDKSIDILVPIEFRGTFLHALATDQLSTAHPYSPLAAAEMADAIQLKHTHPRIYYIPDDPVLGEFRPVFANKLCMLEERPSGKGWEHNELFGNADNIVNSEKMFEKVFESSRNRVDQQAFLQVRLFDMIINDWDRHDDQWIWATHKTNGYETFTPIARDRDQAFLKTDGVFLYQLTRPWTIRQLQHMHSHIKDVRGMNFIARNLDRQFMNELTKDEWKERVSFAQTHLTDASIKEAIHAMPKEVYSISGDFLIKRLTERRNHLMKDGLRYYDVISKRVCINGSEETEQFTISQYKKGQVSVTGLLPGNDTFYHRTFVRKETKEINIYGLGGDDSFTIEGNAPNKFNIRVLGGDGNDKYLSNESRIQGKRIRSFDSVYLQTPSDKIFKSNEKWDTLYRYHRNWVTYDWYFPRILPAYNPDDGFAIGIGLIYRRQTWGKTPFGWQQSVVLHYASGTGAYGFGYNGLFKQTFGKWDFDLTAYYKGPRYTFNFYGYGNETELNGHDKSYFRVKANNFAFSPGASRAWRKTYLRFGLHYESAYVNSHQEKFVTSPDAKLDSATFTTLHFGGVNGQLDWSTALAEIWRTKGIHLNSGFSFTDNLDKSDRKMLKLNGSASFYYPLLPALVFAHRTGAATIFGKYEFYQANSIGGDQYLRGYWRSRFTGKSSFYQNSELRLSLTSFKGAIIRGRFGLFAFFDDGRVWIEDEHSSTLHLGYGGGIFLLPYNRAALTLHYGLSEETGMIVLRGGFFF